MKHNSLILKAILSTLMVTNPVFATTNDTGFKVAIIKNASGSKEIIIGDYNTSIKKINNKTNIKYKFENNMGLCVAHLKLGHFVKSELACTAAVNEAKTMSARDKKNRYLKSISYSNRAISRYLSDNLTGAMQDLTSAILIENNTIVQTNLTLIKEKHSSLMESFSHTDAE
jgi:hypothetical protein